jgi:hypothetical protein
MDTNHEDLTNWDNKVQFGQDERKIMDYVKIIGETMDNKDYIYCETCEMFVDFYKYDHNLEQAGHDKCKWRYVTDEELKGCISDCKHDGCNKQNYNLDIDVAELRAQIQAVLESNMPERYKTGLHNLLGEILDTTE